MQASECSMHSRNMLGSPPQHAKSSPMSSSMATAASPTLKSDGQMAATTGWGEVIFRQPLCRKLAAGGVSESQLNRWNETNARRPFEAGLDKGLRSWAALRRSLAAVAAGDLVVPETIPSRIKYRSGLTYYADTLHDLWYPKHKQDDPGEAAAANDPADGDHEQGSDAEGMAGAENGSDEGGEGAEEANAAQGKLLLPAITRPSSAPLPTVPMQITIINPTFPALSIAHFKELLRTGTAKEVLLVAYHHFHWRYLDMALDAGLGINTVLDANGKTLLFIAVANGDVERIEYLLDHGANAKVRDHRHDTLLHWCMNHPIIFHPRRIATLLINKGADVNAVNKRGVSPLHRAVLLGFLDFAELLLKRKAKVFVFDKSKMLPFQYSSPANKAKLAKLFNANVRFCGKRQHEMMWSYIMSRQFVESIFKLCISKCIVCKRGMPDCAALKKKDFRYWLYVHEVLALQRKGGGK